jgi:hypothetical protein
MVYDDFAITAGPTPGAGSTGYIVSAAAPDSGRVAGILPPVEPGLRAMLAALSGTDGPVSPSDMRAAGEALFRWLLAEPLETHFRLAWDRAARSGHGLRLSLSLDVPEICALPWELMHDPARDHSLATSVATPLVRFLDRSDSIGSLARAEAELPLAMLLVLPAAPGLDAACEESSIREAMLPLHGAVNLHVLAGPVTRASLAGTLLATPFDIVHLTTHGGVLDGENYLQLNTADGGPDWIDSAAFVRLFANARSVKLVVLNACQSGEVAQFMHGCAPQLVRAGVPAVVALQFAIASQAAQAFAYEFYRQLCTGPEAGQVDVAISHARNMLAALFPDRLAFAAPVLYTRATQGRLYYPPDAAEQMASGSESARLALFMRSLQASMDFIDDWAPADAGQLAGWHQTLLWAEHAYTLHLRDPQPAAQEAARHGLTVTQNRLATLEEALLTLTDDG